MGACGSILLESGNQMIRQNLKLIGDELRMGLIYSLARIILRLVPDTDEGNLWVVGLAEIASRAAEMRKIKI